MKEPFGWGSRPMTSCPGGPQVKDAMACLRLIQNPMSVADLVLVLDNQPGIVSGRGQGPVA